MIINEHIKTLWAQDQKASILTNQNNEYIIFLTQNIQSLMKKNEVSHTLKDIEERVKPCER